MTMQAKLASLAGAIGTDVKELRTSRGVLSTLTTTEKTNLVGAINEIRADIQSAVSSAVAINDATTATTTTWSSSKINTQVNNAVSSLVASAPTALDTLNELATALGNDANFATTTATALGLRVRVDVAQTFDSTQKAQGRSNIDAASGTDFSALVTGLGDYDADITALYVSTRDAA